jgi:hypothetical protein
MRNAQWHCRVATSHSRSVPSRLTVASSSPSGENAQASAQLV